MAFKTPTYDTSSGDTILTPGEAVDGARVLFTVSGEPKWVVADGATYYDGSGYTYAGGQITMDVAPSQYIRYVI